MQITNEDYKKLKPLLFSIAYRMLGTVTEAEDLVQDTFLKAYQIQGDHLENKKAYLCKMITNRCLNVLKSARYRREQYVGPWNPEPLIQEKFLDYEPSQILLEKERLSIAYLRMMEHLSPNERASLLLKEVFDFSYSEIANMLEKKEDNCRKLFSRAKQKISNVENESLNYEQNKSIIDRFIQAFQKQDTKALLELISNNVILYSDGGGKVKAAIRPIESLTNVLAFLFGVMKKASQDFYFEIKKVNTQPAILLFMDGKLHSILSFSIFDNEIAEMYLTMNPDKLPF